MRGLGSIVRLLDTVGAVVTIGGRTLLSIDTNPVPAEWNHVTKVDPERGKRLPLAYPNYLQHTGAVSVGGSRDVTDRNTEETFDLLNAAGVTAFHEPSAASHVTDRTREGAEFLAIPEVLNGDSQSLVGTLGEGIEHVRETVAPELIAEKLPLPVTGPLGDRLADFAASWMIHEAVFEAYIIQNVDSAAAREANVTADDLLSPQEAKQRAMAAERHLESEIIYLEYSGTFGGEEAVEILGAIDGAVSGSRLWYGGGLANRENVRTITEAGADAVVVGDVFHDVAEEEAELAERARAALPADVEREAVQEWVEAEVDLEETSAARYLSTILSVPDPQRRAAQYLADGIALALELEGLASELSNPDAEAVTSLLDGERPVPGEATFVDAVGEDAAALARRLGTSLLAERFGLETADGFAADHLAVELQG